MHDIKQLDSLGIPGGFVASEAFRHAADSQSRAMGFDADRVFVPHPIQDRTDDEIRALADAAFDEVLAMITTGSV